MCVPGNARPDQPAGGGERERNHICPTLVVREDHLDQHDPDREAEQNADDTAQHPHRFGTLRLSSPHCNMRQPATRTAEHSRTIGVGAAVLLRRFDRPGRRELRIRPRVRDDRDDRKRRPSSAAAGESAWAERPLATCSAVQQAAPTITTRSEPQSPSLLPRYDQVLNPLNARSDDHPCAWRDRL